MKFIYADSLDYVDPDYDFVRDRRTAGRRRHEDDEFPHEYLGMAPYDGLLVSRSIVGDEKRAGKYTDSQSMRFRRIGARAFLRFPEDRFPGTIVLGDCGAFTYRNEEEPPYQPEDTLEFYADGRFTHGCSVDHLIFDFLDDDAPPSPMARKRYEITLALAERFYQSAAQLGSYFTPVGVIQGWSPKSMAAAGVALAKMGYRYIAVGGMVPLQIEQIRKALRSIHDALGKWDVGLHLLGFGKVEEMSGLDRLGVVSFDTTSPLLRAFKDGKRNYYALKPDGGLDYYTAVRIPQALENPKVLESAKRGRLDQEQLARMEQDALQAVRNFANRKAPLEQAVDQVIAYGRYSLWDYRASEEANEKRLKLLRPTYMRSLGDRPWEACRCRVCAEAGVETMIFRSSNRNKRRGIHNLSVFHTHVQGLREAA